MSFPFSLRDLGPQVCRFVLVLALSGGALAADDRPEPEGGERGEKRRVGERLSPDQWNRLDSAVDRGLKYLATCQQSDGSYKSHAYGQPAVTSFCVMAYLSRGHLPNEGPYGEQIARAVEFVLSKQQANGFLFAEETQSHLGNIVGSYNHAIAGVMLCEVFGMARPKQQKEIRAAVEKALKFSRSEQTKPKSTQNEGGWRYVIGDLSTDLSVTAWHLMFYRSARNAEFDVPEEHMHEALAYVERCYEPVRGTFSYGLQGVHRTYCSRGMAGAGAVSLAMAGKHGTEMAKNTVKYILAHPFDRFNRGGLTKEDRFYYGAYYCSQAMYQFGGKEWQEFYTVLLDTMADNQNRDGSWDPEANQDGMLGNTYSTAFAILALTPPYQLLPIYQR